MPLVIISVIFLAVMGNVLFIGGWACFYQRGKEHVEPEEPSAEALLFQSFFGFTRDLEFLWVGITKFWRKEHTGRNLLITGMGFVGFSAFLAMHYFF